MSHNMKEHCNLLLYTTMNVVPQQISIPKQVAKI
jgi:hypothetical protein